MKTVITVVVTLICVAALAWAANYVWNKAYVRGVADHATWVASVCMGGNTFKMPDGYAYKCDRQIKL